MLFQIPSSNLDSILNKSLDKVPNKYFFQSYKPRFKTCYFRYPVAVWTAYSTSDWTNYPTKTLNFFQAYETLLNNGI